jgi:hypothetical protein
MAGAIMGGIGGYLYGVGKGALAKRGAANQVIGTTPLGKVTVNPSILAQAQQAGMI